MLIHSTRCRFPEQTVASGEIVREGLHIASRWLWHDAERAYKHGNNNNHIASVVAMAIAHEFRWAPYLAAPSHA